MVFCEMVGLELTTAFNTKARGHKDNLIKMHYFPLSPKILNRLLSNTAIKLASKSDKLISIGLK